MAAHPNRRARHRLRSIIVGTIVLAILFAQCTGREESSVAPKPDGERSSPATTSGSVVVGADDPSIAIDRRLFGTNLPAWIGPHRLADPAFRSQALASGATVVRMPGGSFSNRYDWSSCELPPDSSCSEAPWAVRPTDYADFLRDTGLRGMWTVSINETAQSAAALVAFFNGEVGDRTAIGTDRDGRDWGTVDRWARLRAENGSERPPRITLWEIGNEVYGGRPDAGGEECANYGWEHVWTCDGTTYMNGDHANDGYLAIREAMLAVDPSIEIGAVGVANPDAWNDWGREVIEAGRDVLDFYVVHHYGYDSSPDPVDAPHEPQRVWPDLVSDLRQTLGPTPIAITEYNLVSVEWGDADHTMTQFANALYLAETLGQLALQGIPIANQWNLVNGRTGSGTDYGLISLENGSILPPYHALAMWSRAGSRLLPTVDADPDVRIYPTTHDDGRWTVIMLNLGGRTTTVTLELPLSGDQAAGLTTVHAEDPTAVSAATPPEIDVTGSNGRFVVELRPWSMNLLETEPSSSVDGG